MLPDIVLFEGADVGNTTSLWETDGTASGTFELADAPPLLITGEAGFGFAPNTGVSLDLTVFNNQVLFAGRSGPADLGPYNLWTTDGTATGTVPLTSTSSAGENSSGLFTAAVTPGFAVFGDEVLFRGIDSSGADGLWVTDGTAAGTKEVTEIAGTPATGVNPTDITVFNGVALFNGTNTAGKLGLWTTDGTAGGTKEVTSTGGPAGLNPTDMTVFNNEVLFNGVDSSGLSGLWVTGGAAGTGEILAEAPGASAGLDPTDMTVFGGEVLFSGVDKNGLLGLWETDGTAGGTHELLAEAATQPTAKDPHGLSPSDLTVFEGKVFFSGFDQFGRVQLWETDGTPGGAQMLTAPVTGGVGANTSFGLSPSSLEVYHGQILFSGLDSKGVRSLWTTDGTSAGTVELSPISGARPTFGLGPADLTAIGAATPPRINFNDNSDILWQNTSGQPAIWEMNGTNVIGAAAVGPNPGPSWQEVGTGDFNGDGQSDILFQNTNGQVAIWEMNGTNVIGAAVVGPNPGPSWKVTGTGDFNGDGHSDILFQSTNGQVAIWEMNGTNVIGAAVVGPNPGRSWQEVGTGDFNHDGHSDILFQNTNGQVAIWEMNGTNVIGAAVVGPNPGPSWKVTGTGDFNGDGHSDILFQNTNGQVAIWEMNGTNVIGEAVVGPNPGPSWQEVGTGDFNHDGHSDILFQNTSGQAAIWEMNGTNVIGEAVVGPNPGPSWKA